MGGASDPPSLGIDLGATKVACALVDAGGRVLASHRRATEPGRGPERVVADIEAAAQACLAQGARRPAAAGVGVAGQVDAAAGVVRSGPSLPGWRDVPLAAGLEKALAMPVWLTNDVRAAAWGEWRHGAARGEADAVLVFLGTGVGGGVVSGGRVLEGASHVAGELGHATLVAGGRACRCPNQGCLEAYVGGWAIAERAREAAQRDPGAARGLVARAGSADAITAATLAEAFRAGDALAKALVEETGAYLGAGLVGMVHAFNPRVLVLGGGVVEGTPELVGLAERALRARALPAALAPLRVARAALGAEAGVVGAATYARERLAARPG